MRRTSSTRTLLPMTVRRTKTKLFPVTKKLNWTRTNSLWQKLIRDGSYGKTLIEWQNDSFDNIWCAVMKIVNDWIYAKRFVADLEKDRELEIEKYSHQLNDDDWTDRQHPDKKTKISRRRK